MPVIAQLERLAREIYTLCFICTIGGGMHEPSQITAALVKRIQKMKISHMALLIILNSMQFKRQKKTGLEIESFQIYILIM